MPVCMCTFNLHAVQFVRLIFNGYECMFLRRARVWIGDFMQSDVCGVSCVSARECLCAFGSVNLTLNPILMYPVILTTTAFQPQSKAELQDAVETCSAEPMQMRKL